MSRTKHEIVITAVVDPAGNLLMIRRDPDDENNPGKWEFPAGHIDPGEIPWLAGPREVKEETGLDVFLIPYGITVPTGRGPAAYFMGFTDLRNSDVKPEVVLDKKAHDRYLWVKPEDIHRVKPAHEDIEENFFKLYKRLKDKLKIKPVRKRARRFTADLTRFRDSWLCGTGTRVFNSLKAKTQKGFPVRRLTADQVGFLPPRFTRRMPGPGQELKEAILVGDEVEIFLRHNASGYETPDPAISGIVERRNRNMLWIHSPEDDMKQSRSISWDDRGDWAFIRVYRKPDQVVYYVNGNPYDPDSKKVEDAKGLGLILESEPPDSHESVWALMRNETPDLDRSMGQAPQSMDSVAPFRRPKAGTPEILHQVREVLQSYGMEPDLIDGVGNGRVLILTQDSKLKDEISKVLKDHGKEVKSTRTGSLLVRDRRAQGTTTIPLEKDDDLLRLTLRQKQREKSQRKSAPQLPVQVAPGNQDDPTAPQLSVTVPTTQQQIQTLQKNYGALQQRPLPGGKGVQVTFNNPQQLQKFQQDQMQNGSTSKTSSTRSAAEHKLIQRCAYSLRSALRRDDYATATRLLETLLRRGVREEAIIRSPLARKSTWGHFSRYLTSIGEIQGSRVASLAAKVARD